MSAGRSVVLGAVVAALGCGARAGSTVPPTPEEPERFTPTARRMYEMGETRFAQERYAEAVEIWRHALLQLPETPAADELRHALILRMTYGLLMASARDRAPDHLRNAKAVLYRYLTRHEALFGDTDKAREERGEVYEILHQVESRLEPEGEELADGSDAPEPEEEEAAATVARAGGERGRAEDPHAGEALAPNMRRKVRVRTGKWFNTDINDPEIWQRLRGAYSSGESGAVLGAATVAQIHGPRPLLRSHGAPRLVSGSADGEDRRLARQLGRELLRAARDPLKDCYSRAVARRPVMLSDAAVEVSIDWSGRVSRVRVVDGGLVDGLGDVCMVQTLETTRIAHGPVAGEIRVHVPMRFFYEGPAHLDPYAHGYQPDATAGGVPSIDTVERVPRL